MAQAVPRHFFELKQLKVYTDLNPGLLCKGGGLLIQKQRKYDRRTLHSRRS